MLGFHWSHTFAKKLSPTEVRTDFVSRTMFPKPEFFRWLTNKFEWIPWSLRRYACSPRSHGLQPKSVWRCHQLLSVFRANDHLSRVSRQSANNKRDNEIIPGDVHRSPWIYPSVEENPWKYQLGDRLLKAVRPVIASNGVPCLQMRLVGSHSTSGKGEEKKEGTGMELNHKI